MKLKIIYRDAAVIAVHKPAGIATYQESRGQGAPGCKELLEEQLNQRFYPIHRIDADTEGLVLFALDPKSAAGFIRLFKEHKIKKTYLAWCVGEVPPHGSIRTPLKKNKSQETEPARTDYERTKTVTYGGVKFSQVRAFPFTGRFHQIRRHFDSIGFPLVGDPKYGSSEKWNAFFKTGTSPNLQLFAESVEFVHPVSKKNLLIKAKL